MRRMNRLLPTLPVLLFLASSCSHLPLQPQTPLENEGKAILYLQPVPGEARRIRFAIDGISAQREDGNEVPVSLEFSEIRDVELARSQKLLASGFLPEGRYKGLTVTIRKATLLREEGEADLLLPGKPVVVERIFDVKRKRTTPLFLSFLPSKSITDGFRFTPVFSLAPSTRVLADLTGFVTGSEAGTITVFDKKRMQVTGMIDGEGIPKGIVLDQGRRKAYVANARANQVEILDLLSGERIGKIFLNIGDDPRALGMSPDGRVLVSANYGTGTASIIDADSQIESRRVKVGEGPVGVVVDRRGLKAYVMNSLSNTVSVIDLTKKQLLANVAIEGTPLKGDFSKSGDRLYIVSKYSPDLIILDPVKLTRAGKIFVGTGAISIKVDSQTDLIYVGKESDGEISILDPFSQMLIDKIKVRGTPSCMAIDREEGILLVVDSERKKILKANLVSREIMAEMEISGAAYEIVVMGER